MKKEDQVNTWSSISTRKKMVRSGTQTTTKSAILAGSPIMGLPAFYMTIGIAWIMRLTHIASMGAVIDSTEQTASRETSSIFSTTIRVSAILTYPY